MPWGRKTETKNLKIKKKKKTTTRNGIKKPKQKKKKTLNQFLILTIMNNDNGQ